MDAVLIVGGDVATRRTKSALVCVFWCGVQTNESLPVYDVMVKAGAERDRQGTLVGTRDAGLVALANFMAGEQR